SSRRRHTRFSRDWSSDVCSSDLDCGRCGVKMAVRPGRGDINAGAESVGASERLRIVPMTLKEANDFVKQHHRHHGPTRFHKFSIGVAKGDQIVGVAIVGRPVARLLDDGYTLEVTRCCTDGTKNACSMLYGAAWRAARAMG